MNLNLTLEELEQYENAFMPLCMPKHAHRAQDILANECCHLKCVYDLTRRDIMRVRSTYVRAHNRIPQCGKEETRYAFILMIASVSEEHIEFSSVDFKLDMCTTLLARLFGFSVQVLMNGLSSREIARVTSRPWYKCTVDSLSEALHNLSRVIQFNSLNRLMLPPNFSAQANLKVPVAVVRDKLQLPLDERKSDSLTRCVSCSTIPEIIKNSKTRVERREGEDALRKHHQIISQQRVIVDCLGRQGRDPETDVTTCLMDSMSNRCSKLPSLISRPKTIGDTERMTINLTTVQLSERNGDNNFRNIDFPIYQGLFSADSSYNLSLLFHGLSKLHNISSTLAIVMDSCRSNKSFVFSAGLGYFLSRSRTVRKVMIVYPAVGHTHTTVDGHFGTVSKNMSTVNIRDPDEFSSYLKSLPSVAEVISKPTVFNFEPIAQFMYKPHGLCSNGFISISKRNDGVITYSSSLTINSAHLLGVESDTVAKKLFKDEFYGSGVSPSIVSPETSGMSEKIDSVIRSSSVLLTDTNKNNLHNAVDGFGTQSFREVMKEINSIPPKFPPVVPSDNDEPHLSVLEFLDKYRISTGRVPREPSFHASQLL